MSWTTLKGHWKVAESIDNIFTTYQKWKPSVIGLETVAYQKALKSWLEEKMRERGGVLSHHRTQALDERNQRVSH